ncbi:porin [Aestuariibius sp. HNIBRBA575]|uniref:porin n=1 Tax=Aestuariibius sp. HNIBRBA575 TaxID=3233343 RepID=UPI0034A38685
MKSILLASASIVAFAGAAAAEVSFGGDAEIGYNDEVENGFYWSVGLSVSADQTLDNGLTVGFTLDVDIANDDAFGLGDGDDDIALSDYVLSVTSDNAGLYFGDTDAAAQAHWSGVTNMETDGFAETDDGLDEEATLRGEATFGSVTAAASYFIIDANGGTDEDDLVGLQVAAVADMGQYNFILAYQEEALSADTGLSADIDQIIGLAASSTFGSADVTFAYTSNSTDDTSSVGVEVAYPFGPVTATVFYVSEDGAAEDYNAGVEVGYSDGPVAVDFWYHTGNDEEIGLEGSYDVGNGVMVYAGYIQNDGDSDATELYVAGTYDLGGGAELLVSYGEEGDTYAGDADEIGSGYEVNQGTTVAVSFDF